MVGANSGGGRRPRVLLLDDDEKTLRAYARALGDEIEIIGVTDPAKAIEILASGQHLDAAIFDILGVDGYRVAARARELRPDLPIAMLSGSREAEDVNPAALARPAIPFLAKAESTDDIRRWIRAVTRTETRVEDAEVTMISCDGPLRGIRAVVVDRQSLPGDGRKEDGEVLGEALRRAGADVSRISATAVSAHLATIRTSDVVFVRLHCTELLTAEAGIGIAREIESVQPSPPVILFVGPADPKPEIAVETGEHRRLVDAHRLMHAEAGGPEPRLAPFVLAVVTAARASEAERCLRADLPPVVVPRQLPNPFPLRPWLRGRIRGLRRLMARGALAEEQTQKEAAENLCANRWIFRHAAAFDDPQGLRDCPPGRIEPRKVLVYSRREDADLDAALRARGLEPVLVHDPALVAGVVLSQGICIAIIDPDDGRGVIAANAILRLAPGVVVFLAGPVSMAAWIVAKHLGLADRLLGDVSADVQAALAEHRRLRLEADATSEHEFRLAGRPDLDAKDAQVHRAEALDLRRLLKGFERDAIVAALDQYGSARKAYERLGFSSVSNLLDRMTSLRIPARGGSRTPPSVPQVA